jgi:glycine/D-amino acid oxidase-like deaminating enzyme
VSPAWPSSIVLAPVTWPVLGDGPWPSPVPPPSIPLPSHAACVVIGAGVTGLACAAALADAGRDVLLIDRRFGAGAACRSGGIVVGDTLVGPAPGFVGCETELREWIRQHAPQVELRWTGCLELDRNPGLPAAPIDWRDHGTVRQSRVVEGGTLDPARLVAALGAHAVACGVRFVDDVAVSGLGAADRGARIYFQARQPPLFAAHVLIATDAAAACSPFDPWPVRQLTIALETEPVADDRFAAMGWNDRQPFYTNDLPLLWGRVLDERRILAGRELLSGEDLSHQDIGAAIDDAGRRLTTRVRGLHPALADVVVRRVWAGPIARDATGIPKIHRHPAMSQVWWAGGYGGHGLAAAFRLGRLAAKALLAA